MTLTIGIASYLVIGLLHLGWYRNDIDEWARAGYYDSDAMKRIGGWILFPVIYPLVDLVYLGGWLKAKQEEKLELKEAKKKRFALENRKLEAQVKALEEAGEFK